MVEASEEFSAANFRDPKLPHGLQIIDVSLEEATPEALHEVGARLISGPDEISVANKNFDIVKWPVQGWRQLDPQTGDEGGTVEGDFDVYWDGDFYFGENKGIASKNNKYLDGLAVPPEHAKRGLDPASGSSSSSIHLWMSDYHPDGGQLFWCERHIPFVVCLGPSVHRRRRDTD